MANLRLKDLTFPGLDNTYKLPVEADDFSTTKTYSVGEYCIHDGVLCQCTTAISTAGAWDATKWSIDVKLADEVSDLKSALSILSNEIDDGLFYVEAVTTASWSKKVVIDGLTFKANVKYTINAVAPETQRIYLVVCDSSGNAIVPSFNEDADHATVVVELSETKTNCYVDYRSNTSGKQISIKCTSSENINERLDAVNDRIDNYVVPDDSITPEQTTFMLESTGYNIFNKDENQDDGKWYTTSVGKVILQSNQYTGAYHACKLDVENIEKLFIVPRSDFLTQNLYNYMFSESDGTLVGSVTVNDRRFVDNNGYFEIAVPQNQDIKYFYFNLRGTAGEIPFVSVNVGELPLPYEPYTIYFDINVKDMYESKQHRIVIGEKIYAVIGDTLQIFHDAIVESDINYILKIDCEKGENWPRYFEYTPVSGDAGTYPITFTLLDYSGKLIDIVKSSIVVKAAANPESETNILCIGDSTMQNGNIPIEASRRFKGTSGYAAAPEALSLTNLNLTGRKQNSGGTVGWEGNGGWTFGTYTSSGVSAVRFTVTDATDVNIGDIYFAGTSEITVAEINVTSGSGNIRFTGTAPSDLSQTGTLSKKSGNGQSTITYTAWSSEAYQPFWNTTEDKFDIASYVDEYCGGNVEYIPVLLGINTLISMEPFASLNNLKNSMINFIDLVHQDLPDAKILLSTIPLASTKGGIASNYGAGSVAGKYDANGFNHKIYSWNALLCELEADGTLADYNTELINSHAQFDVEYSMPTGTKAANTRSTTQEVIQTNGVHPSDGGYWQLSDALVFRSVLGLLA